MKDILVYSGPMQSGEMVKKMLGGRFEVRFVEPTNDSLLPEFEGCTVFLDASMKVPISADTIFTAKNLKLIVTATTGANHIDQKALQERDIPLLTLKGQKEVLHDITSAAEHSWLLLMACVRKLRGAIHHVENTKWERTEFPGIMLKDKMLGIIGMGRLGTWMARYASAFGMKIQGYDPFVQDFPEYVNRVNLETLVSQSDIITLHVGLSEENKGMLTAEIIRTFKPGCVFINTSRGELVDEVALVKQMKEGRIAAVGVDVLTGEPEIAKNPLWQYAQKNDHVIITPHIGGFCPESVDKVVKFSCERILSFFDDRNER